MTPRPWDRRYALLVGLTATAATLDALAFLRLGKVFNSFQSGNVLFLGLGAGSGDGGLVIRAAAVIAAFVAGAAVGARVVGSQLQPGAVGRELTVFRVEAALLAAFAALWIVLDNPADHAAWRVVLLALGAAAMGVQVALALALKIPNVVTVALTATLAYIGQRIGTRAGGPSSELPSTGLLVAVCATYAVCAVLVATLPETPVLAVAPLALLTVAVALDSNSNRAWRVA